MNSILKAANVTVPAYYPGLFERVFQSRNLDDILASSTASAGPAPAAPAGGAAPADEGKKEDKKEDKKEKKKEEEEEEADADMGGLFGGDDEDGY